MYSIYNHTHFSLITKMYLIHYHQTGTDPSTCIQFVINLLLSLKINILITKWHLSHHVYHKEIPMPPQTAL